MTEDNLTKEVLKELKKISDKDKKKVDKQQKEWDDGHEVAKPQRERKRRSKK